MSGTCPKTCSWLTTAAILLSVSIVQFAAGMILLKSKYVFLLCGPNFWTSASNFFVGCLIGVAASVWKNMKENDVKKKCLSALAVSALMVNTTTVVILIMGEGNTLLSIQLEKDTTENLTSEILAYAYAVSVCSPVICIIVSLAFLCGICLPNSRKQYQRPKKDDDEALPDDSSRVLNWVYDSDKALPKPDPEIMKFASSRNFHSQFLNDNCDSDSISIVSSGIRYDSAATDRLGTNTDISLSRDEQRCRSHSDRSILKNSEQKKIALQKQFIAQVLLEQNSSLPKQKLFLSRKAGRPPASDRPHRNRDLLRLYDVGTHSAPFPPTKRILGARESSKSVTFEDDAITQDETCQSCCEHERRIFVNQAGDEFEVRIPITQRIGNAEDDDVIVKKIDPHIYSKTRLNASKRKKPSPDILSDKPIASKVGTHPLLQRTSTAKSSYDPNEFLMESEISHRNFMPEARSLANNSEIEMAEVSVKDSAIVDDDFDSTFNSTVHNSFTGEVVPIKLNSTTNLRKLSRKLIPVPIPNINSIKNLEPSDMENHDYMDKFSRQRGFTSFRVGEKFDGKTKGAISKSFKPVSSNQALKLSRTGAERMSSIMETSDAELSSQSPAHTSSGYVSSFEDTSDYIKPAEQILNKYGINSFALEANC